MEFRADMHCHSTCSDGTLTPLELVYLARKVGLSGLAIADHDTTDAYTDDLFVLAEEVGIQLKTGVEFSAQVHGTGVHILGYGYDYKNQAILDFCAEHVKRRTDRNRKMLQKLMENHVCVEECELCAEGVVGRPHIAEQMVKKGYVKTMREAFDRYLGDNKCCFDPGTPFSCEDTIDIIHQAGGKAFIAHPCFIRKKKALDAVLAMDFDGMECFYSTMPSVEEARWYKIAKDRGFLVSGGSDYHGGMNPDIELGASWIGAEDFNLI
ncbi:MAG: 5'-3' exoribonuclease [Chlamydiia bacterium]|nr:5'-3' exoribonuclease [Chlamydiia bacterium]MCH9615442.1 5'-3' exoribonuclease [Chlamydiia bacterium]MCH9628236.1 5'-3' exoribonuclease [Chlamydiia bacterium]